MKRKILPGRSYPLGATHDGKGANFALFSRNAEKVELCLFDRQGREERITVPEYTDEVWNCYIPGIKPGQAYGWRAYGKYDPHAGHRFNGHKLLLDPYARAFSGALRFSPALFGYRLGDPAGDMSFSTEDSAPHMPKSVVTAQGAPPAPEKPQIRRTNSIIYELHVRGATMAHPKIPAKIRGTFAALAHPEFMAHVKDLGVTAIEIMPAQAFFRDAIPEASGLYNYWGYNTAAFFAPEPAYGSADEFRSMVDEYHRHGMEVIMDVVYNHTAEGSEAGPTLSFRGIDNASYYRLADDKRYYYDTTGVGNSLDFNCPRVNEMVMDSLRYWANEMGADGFRFDLAVTLGRGADGFSNMSGFYNAIAQDPTMRRVKKIAEPWDVGAKGWQLGNFPAGWSEWNGLFRNTARRFWRGDPGMTAEMATRFSGSSELFEHRGRRPWAGVNYATSHDGFTLMDLVSFDAKHNEANGNGNSDGEDENFSANYGNEGKTADESINKLRLKQMKNLVATTLLSQGLPMLLGGDEMARTQRGNNNAYVQDNETSWWDWSKKPAEFHDFVKKLVSVRKSHTVFRRSKFYRGEKDIEWLRPDGKDMAVADWKSRTLRTLVLRLYGADKDNFHTDK
ncbi:MAG: glycogen debranching protein GlgX, partial [Rickettsiales bacterium]|nr:glycogen debranching protein GlgX [Rickettsiales bacterium]